MLIHTFFILIFLAGNWANATKDAKRYHYKPVEPAPKSATPLTPASTSPLYSVSQPLLLYPRVVPFYPGLFYYPQVILGNNAGVSKKLNAYSIPAPDAEASGRTNPDGRDLTPYFGKIKNNGAWKPLGDGPFQTEVVPASPRYPPPPQGRAPHQSYQTSITLCYFVGDDILKSHLMYNKNWAFVPRKDTSGLTRYINDLTLEANKLLGQDNFQLAWLGDGSSRQGLLPFSRHSPSESLSDKHLDSDVKGNAHRGCDANIFLLFNNFFEQQVTEGFKFSGLVKGGACDAYKGEGYAVVADQGYSDETWVGPQVLAHFLLRLLTSDICSPDPNGVQGWSHNCFCKNEKSLLNPYVRPGTQYLDKCAVDKLNQSNISNRQCLRDPAILKA